MKEFWETVLECRKNPQQLKKIIKSKTKIKQKPRKIFRKNFIPDEPDEPQKESIFKGTCLIKN